MAIFLNKNTIESADISSDGVFDRNIVREGLQCYYDVNNSYSWPETGTTWYNIAHNHSHLTKASGLNTTTFSGTSAWNMNYDGAVLSGTHEGGLGSGNATLEAWIWPGASEVTSGDRGTVIIISGGSAQYMSWNKSNRYLSTYWYGSTANGYHETNGPTAREGWAHWCTVWDAKVGKLFQYVNGTSVGIATTVNSSAHGTNIVIGRESSGRQFSGGIAEIRIYNRALHAHEVLQNYFSSATKYS